MGVDPAPRILDDLHAVEAVPPPAADVASGDQQERGLPGRLPRLEHVRQEDPPGWRLVGEGQLARKQVLSVGRNDRAGCERAAQVLDLDLHRLAGEGRADEGEMRARPDHVVPPAGGLLPSAARGAVGPEGK